MKTTSFNVERNYRIDNSDQYMKARFSQEVTPDEGETAEDAALRAIKQMDNIFRIAYPHVAEHLNFHVIRQEKRQINWHIENQQWNVPPHEIKPIASDILQPKKTNKGTIEEQIEACTTLPELESFKLIAGMNEKLLYIYEQRKAKIEHKKSNTQHQ